MALDFRKSISNPNALDIGNKTIQKRIVSKTIQLSLFTRNKNAVWASKQQLMKESYPFASIRIIGNRDLFRKEVGDCFKFSYSPYGISNMICRVLLVEEKALDSETIIIHAVEDFFSVANSITVYSDPLAISSLTVSYDLLPFVDQIVIEAPYLLTPDVEVIPIAARRSDVDLGMQVYLSVDGGISYLRIGAASNLRPYGTLVGSYSADTYTIDNTIGFTIDFSTNDVDLIETTTWPYTLAGLNNNALLGDELITFQTITPISGTQYKLENVIRGRLDTEKVAHSNGEAFYWLGSYNLTSLQYSEIVAGADRKFKLVPYNIKYTGDLSEATAIDLSIGGRARKPYVPKNFLANGTSFASRYLDDIVLTWSPRYRGRGAGMGTPGEVLPDSDREGYFEIEVWVSDVLMRTATAIDAATWTYTAVMNVADNGALAPIIVFKLLNYRTEDGYVYESDQVEVTCHKS